MTKHVRYNHSPKGQERNSRYEATEKARVRKRNWWRRYSSDCARLGLPTAYTRPVLLRSIKAAEDAFAGGEHA